MKSLLKTIVTGFFAGIFGAFVYQQFMHERLSGKQDLILTENELETKIEHKLIKNDLGHAPPQSPKSATHVNDIDVDFVRASKRSTPSVVFVKTKSERYASTWMEWFFGERSGQNISTGSGVIYSSDGYVITNHHVIDGSQEIEVMVGKRPYPATLQGTDPSTDIAVLKIEAKNLPDIKFGSSKALEVGESVLAVGNPFNLTSTVTAGIVSAKGRELNILDSNFPIESFIQTDAAINPGNSGGALVNRQGELVGINTAILSRTGSYAGYGFAVPSDIVRKIVDDIIQYGMVQKAFFGGEVFDINSEIAKKLDINNYDGVVLGYLQEGGAADEAGLEKGDIILSINDEEVNTKSEFEELLSYRSPGDVIRIQYKRDKKVGTATIELTNKEGTTELLKRELFTSKSLGADFEKVAKVERDLLNIKNGVRIVNVRNGFIRQMNLPEGFIVCYINKIPIETPEQLSDILERIKGRVLIEGVNKNGKWDYYRYYF